VWPDAQPKVYLTARLAVRADRRHKEVEDLEYDRVAADMATRDTLDSTRDASPLQVPDGCVVIDTTDHTVDEVVELVMGLVQ
jgi:cytidylate kinase